MSIADALSIDNQSTRAKILRKVDPKDFAWALPVMRAGYAGRALVYLLVALVSLWSISQGGQASGTEGVMQTLTGDAWPVVALIAAGMFAYAIWRLIDCFADLEAYGTSPKGLVARAGMLVTGTVHAGIGLLALSSLGVGSGSSPGSDSPEQSGSSGAIASVLSMPAGQWLVGIAGILTVCSAVYYFHKGITEGYREHLMANSFTTKQNGILKIGVIAQGCVVGIIGMLIFYAALQADAQQAGGLGAAFDWLREQPYGQALVIALCVGLLAFAVFCAVNAVYRIVPKASDGRTQNMKAYFKNQQDG